MATLRHSLLTISLLLPLIPQSLSNSICDTPDQSSTLKLFHITSPCSPFYSKQPLSWEDTLLQSQAKDTARLVYLSSLVAKKSVVPLASGKELVQNPNYVVRAKFGTPPQTLMMALDTSNDAAWVPCTGCVGCGRVKLATAKSTSFKSLNCGAAQCKQVPNPTCAPTSCNFIVTYGSSTISMALSQDTLKLAMDPIPSYTFGCIQKTNGTSLPLQGLLGLGRGPLSLLSQSQSIYHSTFSYCLPSPKGSNFSGSLRLGPIGQPIRIKYTPLLKNPRRSSLYYVNLVAIRVGNKIVDIPASALAFNPSTGAGTIFDSGTTFTRLVLPAYTAVRDEFRRRVGKGQTVTSLGGFDTCYNSPFVSPTITFMFAGMNVTLPPDNFLIHSTSSSTTCLAMAAAPDNVNSVLNVIASWQQQNHRLLFDVPNSRVGVAREPCS